MNICFIIGKIISDVKFDFVIGNNKYLKNGKISVVRFKVELLDENVVNIIGYNDIADFCYQKLDKNYNVIVEGIIKTEGYIEIEDIELKWKIKRHKKP